MRTLVEVVALAERWVRTGESSQKNAREEGVLANDRPRRVVCVKILKLKQTGPSETPRRIGGNGFLKR